MDTLCLRYNVARNGFSGGHSADVGCGLHSDWFYRRLENAADGLMEVKVAEQDEQLKIVLRVSSMKGQPHDARWHAIKIGSGGEAALTN